MESGEGNGDSLSRSSSRTGSSPDAAERKGPDYLIQFHLTIKSDSMKYALELRWIAGENREHLHAILVYLKNHLLEFLK